MSTNFKGRKALAILALVEENPELSRREIAEQVGCTVQRVGEVLRATGLSVAKKRVVDVKPEPQAPVIDEKDVYGYVMAMLAEGKPVADEDFEIARAYAKRTKKRQPKRP